jgi:hypothetical protein
MRAKAEDSALSGETEPEASRRWHIVLDGRYGWRRSGRGSGGGIRVALVRMRGRRRATHGGGPNGAAAGRGQQPAWFCGARRGVTLRGVY